MKQNSHSLLVCRKTLAPHTHVYVGAPGGPGAAPGGTPPGPAAGPTLARDAEQNERRARLKRKEKEAEVQRSDWIRPEIKQIMREALGSGSTERENLVDQVLNGELSPEDFRIDYEDIESEDRSWGNIFDHQRETRKRIQNLQRQTESYREVIPHQKKEFDGLLKEIRTINRRDDSDNRTLKRQLDLLLNGDPTRRIVGATLTQDQIKAIYALDPSANPNWEQVLARYQADITAYNGGKGAFIFRKIVALKREEKRNQALFFRLQDRARRIIERNLTDVEVQAKKEYMLRTASAAVGITLTEGIEIQYDPVNTTRNQLGRPTVTIRRIHWPPDTIIPDRNGHPVDRVAGTPKIEFNEDPTSRPGFTGEGPMTLGRFKKWADANDAVEVVPTITSLEDKCGLLPYGVKIKRGMELFYPRRIRKDKTGELETIPTYVLITDIDDAAPGGLIRFSRPVVYQPGFRPYDDYEMKDELTFGEFAKWWHRYEVERAVSLNDVQEELIRFNELENHTFGIEAKNNPPINVNQDEVLIYPDGSDARFTITNVRPDGVHIDSMGLLPFPQFLYWVKNNHVRKLPSKDRPQEEKKIEEYHAKVVKKEKEEEEEALQRKIHDVLHHTDHAAEKIEKVAAGSPMERIKQIWWRTQFLSFKDLFNVGHEVVEFVKRRHERRSKGRFGTVGKRLPGVLGAEFDRVRQEAETGEVNKYKEAMEHWGIPEIQQVLKVTNDADVAKACILTLVHKGEVRWDDHHLWATLNRLTRRFTNRGTDLYIPEHPEDMPPGISGEDKSRDAIDALWGAGTAAEWYMESTSKYNSNKNNFEWKFKQLENDAKGTGGPAGECKILLKKWKAGEYVNPQEYEAMIDNAIKYGKMDGEQKVFYIMCGVLARNGKTHETLLHIDRLGELNSKYLNQFPMLDYFTRAKVKDPKFIDPKTGEIKPRQLKLEDYEEIKDKYFKQEFDDNDYGPYFNQYLWEVILPSDPVRTRVSKGIRSAENMDHDDAHFYIPLTSASEIDGLTQGPSGEKKYFTPEGYMNGYAGFNQWIVSLSYTIEEATDPDVRQKRIYALQDAVGSYIRYDAILDSRLHKEKGSHMQRLDDTHFRKRCVVDPTTPLQTHRDQLRNFILEVGAAYGQDWASWLYGPKTGSVYDKDELEKQKKYEARLESLKDLLPRLIEQDNGLKLLEVIKRARARPEDSKNALRGIKVSRRPDIKFEDDDHAEHAHAA